MPPEEAGALVTCSGARQTTRRADRRLALPSEERPKHFYEEPSSAPLVEECKRPERGEEDPASACSPGQYSRHERLADCCVDPFKVEAMTMTWTEDWCGSSGDLAAGYGFLL